jgi:hypothetical protein
MYRDAKYPTTHLRTLEGCGHPPIPPQTVQELAWCEGMTTNDPARLAASFDALDEVKADNGWVKDESALYAVAKRIATFAGAPDALKARAAKAAQSVEELAKSHAESIAKSLGKGKGDKLDDAVWVAELPCFLRDFDGLPQRDAVAKDWDERLAKHKADAVKSLREFYRTRQKEPAKAFAAGVEAVRVGFLWCECADPEFLKQLATWRGDAKLKLGKADQKAYDDVVAAFISARKKGLEAYAEINKKE